MSGCEIEEAAQNHGYICDEGVLGKSLRRDKDQGCQVRRVLKPLSYECKETKDVRVIDALRRGVIKQISC